MGKKKSNATQDENLALDTSKQEEFSKKLAEIDGTEEMKLGTIYIGHIPHGFYENEMKSYFSQFGTVTKVRLARSKKTGGYKGYGYVQFFSEDVAKIAAEAMNNYLMFDKLLKCQYIPEEKLHPDIWRNHNKKFVWVNRKIRHKKAHNKIRTDDELKKCADRLIKKDEKKRKQILALGISYEFPGYEAAMKKKKLKTTTAKKTKKVKKTD